MAGDGIKLQSVQGGMQSVRVGCAGIRRAYLLGSLLLLLLQPQIWGVRTARGSEVAARSATVAAAAHSRSSLMATIAPRTSPQRNSFSTRKARSARSASEQLPPYLVRGPAFGQWSQTSGCWVLHI